MPIINNDDLNKRLDIFLTEYYKGNYSRKILSNAIEKNLIKINSKNVKPSYKLKQNDNIEIDEKINDFLQPDNNIEELDINLDIIYEDDDLIVLNKPKNLLTHPTKYDRKNTLVNALIKHCRSNLSNVAGADRLGIVHRLDKNTAGLMLVAKNNNSHKDLANQIAKKTVIRKYLAIALGNFNKKEGIIDKPLLHYIKDTVKMTISDNENIGLKAITKYKVLEEFKGATLLELELKTGRTHQIRAHLASIKHPIFGDTLYGAKSYERKEFHNIKTIEQLLQSYYIYFEHPSTKQRFEFLLDEQKYSADFIKVLNFLRRNNDN